MTHSDYDCDELIEILREFGARHPHLRLILEPGSAFTSHRGVGRNHRGCGAERGVTTAMMDASFAPLPDCLEMPYKPAIIGAHDTEPTEEVGDWATAAWQDFMGDWTFDDGHTPRVGERIIFEDMIHYTMVKTTMFNGVSHPSIAIIEKSGEARVVKRFGYEDYRDRLS